MNAFEGCLEGEQQVDQEERPSEAKISRGERIVSLAAGGVLLGLCAPRLVRSLALPVAAGYLLYRGSTGQCPLSNSLLGKGKSTGEASAPSTAPSSTASPSSAGTEQPSDASVENEVDEAAWESFPASDPPSYSGSTASRAQPDAEQA